MGRLIYMNRNELREAHYRLEEFIEPLLPLFGRSERRYWGEFYVNSLLLEGRRKNLAGMAGQYGGDKQSLQQFITDSPWDYRAVRKELAKQMMGRLGKGLIGWIVDDTGFAKKGKHSVAVSRQYSGTLGMVGNCQVAVSLNFAQGDMAFPLDFDLYVPDSWISDIPRRKKAGIPDDVNFKVKWEIALDMMERARIWGIEEGVVIADSGYGESSQFRVELQKRHFKYVVGVKKDLGVWLHPVEMERPIKRREVPACQSALEVAKSLPRRYWRNVTWREGSKGPMRSRFAAIRVQPSHGYQKWEDPEGMQWLLIEWPEVEPEPTKYWLCNLPEDTRLKELVCWAKMRWHVEQNYEQLKDELGLDHFEGRSFMGWHHHVTLTMIAFVFLVSEGIGKKRRRLDSAQSSTGFAASAASAPGILPSLQTADNV